MFLKRGASLLFNEPILLWRKKYFKLNVKLNVSMTYSSWSSFFISLIQ